MDDGYFFWHNIKSARGCTVAKNQCIGTATRIDGHKYFAYQSCIQTEHTRISLYLNTIYIYTITQEIKPQRQMPLNMHRICSQRWATKTAIPSRTSTKSNIARW